MQLAPKMNRAYPPSPCAQRQAQALKRAQHSEVPPRANAGQQKLLTKPAPQEFLTLKYPVGVVAIGARLKGTHAVTFFV